MRKSIILFSLLIIAAFVILGVYNAKINYNENFAKGDIFIRESGFNLLEKIKSLKGAEVISSFPEKEYIENASFGNVGKLRNDLQLMDSFNRNTSMDNLKYLSEVLTKKLSARYEKELANISYDSMNFIVHWCNNLKAMAEVDSKNSIFYKVVVDHWMSFVANKLSTLQESNNDIKYDFKYKYLAHKTAENNYMANISFSNGEKAFNHFTNTNFGYLYNRFFLATSTTMKIGMALFLAITLYGYYCIIKLNTIKINKK